MKPLGKRTVEWRAMKHAGWFLLSLLLVCSASAADRSTIWVQVIRGTDKEKPSDASYRQIGPKLAGRLSPVFRWKHYWEVERKQVQLKGSEVTKVALAGQRTLEIERLKSGETEVRLFRRSGLVTKNRQAAHGKMMILGGEESSRDSFFVVVRPDEPVTD
jgi:hypothetical protein